MTRKQFRQTILFFCYFLLVLFFADKIVYVVFNKLSDRVYAGHTVGKLNHYLALKDTTNIIVFGSSRIKSHVDTELFPASAFNIGLDGMKLAFYTPLMKLLPKNKEQIVMLQLDWYYDDYNGQEIRYLMSKYHREPIIKQEIDRLGISSPLMSFFWSLDYNGVVLGLLDNLLNPSYNFREYSGFEPEILNEAQKQAARKIVLGPKTIACDGIPEPNEIIRQRIKEIKTFCEQNQKRFIVFTAPKFVEDCPEKQKGLVEFMLKEEIEYYDFSNYFNDKDSIEYWRDRTHFTSVPAHIFTKHLIDSIPALNELVLP